MCEHNDEQPSSIKTMGVSQWLSEYLSEWLDDWETEWLSEYLSEWLDDWETEWLSFLLTLTFLNLRNVYTRLKAQAWKGKEAFTKINIIFRLNHVSIYSNIPASRG